MICIRIRNREQLQRDPLPEISSQGGRDPGARKGGILVTIENWLDVKFPEVSPMEFYRDLFPAGELEKKGEQVSGKYTGIIVSISQHEKKENGQKKVYKYTITDDLKAIEKVIKTDNFCLCSPLTYAGQNRTAERARMLYAITVDLDRIRTEPDSRTGYPEGMRDLWHQITKAKYLPRPTYIVNSGTGIHLYYVLENPIPLYPAFAFELQEYKRELTRKIWNDFVIDIKDPREIQQEGIYQGFRMPGTITKNGGRARAFKTGKKVTMEYMNSFVDDIFKGRKAAKHQRRGRVSLAAAKENWPEWYERRITNGQKRGTWNISRNLYDWWLEKIKKGATVGHRYYCMMMLAVYAQKCSHFDAKHNPEPVTREELEKDCFSLLNRFDRLTNDENNHFTEDDILAALEAFDERWTTYPRASVEYKSAIRIEPNKRNGQKQKEHLEEARAIRDIRAQRRGEKWDDNGGRKEKYDVVQEWKTKNPKGKKADCIRETGLSKKTVYKHWLQRDPLPGSGAAAAARAAGGSASGSGAAAAARPKLPTEAEKAIEYMNRLIEKAKNTQGAEVSAETIEAIKQAAATIESIYNPEPGAGAAAAGSSAGDQQQRPGDLQPQAAGSGARNREQLQQPGRPQARELAAAGSIS